MTEVKHNSGRAKNIENADTVMIASGDWILAKHLGFLFLLAHTLDFLFLWSLSRRKCILVKVITEDKTA